jgi:ankyrin repeat protein
MSARGRENNDGINDLMIATLNNHPHAVAALLRRGAYPDVQNATGWAALMSAERKGHAEVARLLGHGRVEKPLPSVITSAGAKAAGGEEDLDLSECPDQIRE